MADKNCWQSMSDSADGCFNAVCAVVAVVVGLFLLVLFAPTLTSTIWRVIVFAIEHILPVALVLLAVFLVLELGAVLLHRVKGK